MIKKTKRLQQFEKEFVQKNSLSHLQALKLLDGMWEMGMALGVLPPDDPWEGIEVDIRVARIVNCFKEEISFGMYVTLKSWKGI